MAEQIFYGSFSGGAATPVVQPIVAVSDSFPAYSHVGEADESLILRTAIYRDTVVTFCAEPTHEHGVDVRITHIRLIDALCQAGYDVGDDAERVRRLVDRLTRR